MSATTPTSNIDENIDDASGEVMTLYPPNTEEKVGFDVLKHRIGRFMLSPMGRQCFEQQTPSSDIQWIRQELQRVVALQEVYTFDDPAPFQPVEDVSAVFRHIAPSGASAELETLLDVARLLEVLRRVRDYFSARQDQYPVLKELTDQLVAFPHLEKRIAEVVDVDGRMKDSASPELKRIRRKMVATQQRLRESLMRELQKSVSQGYTTEAQPTVRSGRMVIPVRAEAKRKVSGFVHDVSSTGQTVYIEPASCLDLNNEVRAIEAEEHHEIRRILIEVADQLRSHVDSIRQGALVYGRLDVLQAKARLANELNAHAVRVNENGAIRIVKGRNPALLLHFDAQNKTGGAPEANPRTVTPLDLSLGETVSTLILTGPNAGGKTVAMKTVGLFALMLAYGIPLPADEKTEFSVFERLILDIGDEQSIENDLSTFSSHVANLRYMLDRADERTLVLIDEAGTGTDPAEGAALAQAVFERLTSRHVRTVATTHHGSLKVFAHQADGIENGSMEFDQATLRPTYRLRMGVPGSSYAFEIASRMGLDAELLGRSRALIGNQAARLEDLILSLESRNQALYTRLQEAEQTLEEASVQRQQYETLRDELEEQKNEIKEKALEEAESVVQEANARIERTIREIKESQAAKEPTRQVRTELERFKEKLSDEKKRTTSRKARRSKRGSSRKSASQPAPSTEALRVGDQVILDSGSTPAELLELSGKEAVIMAGSMHMRVDVDRLTKVAGPKKQKVIVGQVKAAHKDGLTALKASNRIDLRGKRVDEALADVARFVDDAVAANIARVEIVHGKGTGALRNAIHEYLERLPEIGQFEEAPYNEGGPGVTYAFLA